MNKPTPILGGRSIRCILFDLGYTIWDRRRGSQLWSRVEAASNRRAVAVLRQHLAPELLPPGDDDVLGARLREMFDEHQHDMVLRDPVHEADGPLAVLLTLKDWGIENPDEMLGRRVFEELNIRVPDSLPLLKDAHSTLATLQERGYRLGIVSNRRWGGKALREDLQTLGLLNYFDEWAIAISADLGVRKPTPALFWHALNGLHATPEESAMVGDSLRADILGGQKLGLFTVWLPRAKEREKARQYLSALHASPAHQTFSSQLNPPSRELSSEETATHTSSYDRKKGQGQDGYLEQFLRGEIKPDLIIDQVSDLLDVFLPR